MRSVSVVLVGALVAACSETTPTETLVGVVTGTDAVVGMVREGDRARMYVCGGPETFEIHRHWFNLVEETPGFWQGSSTQDGRLAELTAQEDGTITGTVTGTADDVSVVLDPAGPNEGPWSPSSSLAPCDAGVVVLGGGLAMQGVHYCEGEGLSAQVVPIGGITPDEGVIPVRLATDPTVEFDVVPAAPSL